MFDHILYYYCNIFKLLRAETSVLLQKSFEIRHSVYCQELGWEPLNEAEQEKDSYDDNAEHILLLHRPSKNFIGCVRGILVNPSAARLLFPFENHLEDILAKGLIDPRYFKRQTISEISRLAILGNIRHNKGNLHIELENGAEHLMAVFLYLGIAAICHLKKIPHLFGIMEPKLARHIKLCGGELKQVSDVFEHRGQRAVFYINLNTLLKTLTSPIKKLFKCVSYDLLHTSKFNKLWQV